MLSKRRVTLNFQGSRTLEGAYKRRLKPAATKKMTGFTEYLLEEVPEWERKEKIGNE